MRRRRSAQSGNVVAAVTAIGAAGTLALSAVMNSGVVLEERAIDAHLAEVRAYWGAMGQFNYALSRAAYSKTCAAVVPCDLIPGAQGSDVTKANAVQWYLNELGSLGYRTLTYPEENAATYFINLTATAAPDDTPGKNARTGHLMMTTGFDTTQGSAPVLANAATQLPRYELRFCVGIGSDNAPCNNMNGNGGGHYTEHYRLKRLTRLPN